VPQIERAEYPGFEHAREALVRSWDIHCPAPNGGDHVGAAFRRPALAVRAAQEHDLARMRLLISVVLLASVSVGAQAQPAQTAKPPATPPQAALPPDIDPVTLSRLPPVTPQDLDDEGKKLLAARPDFKAGPGPAHVTIYSPNGRTLGVPTGENSPVGPRYFQLAVLIMAREIDQQYEWSAHEPAGRRQGLEQSVIDIVKHNRPVTGLSDKDATLITFGRTLYREHKVSSELWAKMVGHFGRQHTVQLMMIMGDYFRVGFMMNAVDQHLPPTREALLPPR
jgi:hypothetical protein